MSKAIESYPKYMEVIIDMENVNLIINVIRGAEEDNLIITISFNNSIGSFTCF